MTSPSIPELPDGVRAQKLRLVTASPETLAGYGTLVSDYEAHSIEIVTWPAQGWRPVDPNTGNEGGTTEGRFEFWWDADHLYGRNTAVGGHYFLGWRSLPQETPEPDGKAHVHIWHANYHPDGGQLFFPEEGTPFVAPLALPGDDIGPQDFTTFYFDGSQGLYIHPNVWHEAVFPLAPRARFLDRQGRVHARVSCDFLREFGRVLSVPLHPPSA